MASVNTILTGYRRRLLLLALFLVLVLSWSLSRVSAEAEAGASDKTNVAAVVEGRSVTMDELQAAAAGQLKDLELRRLQLEAQLESQKHLILQDSLNRLVEDQLLALEAESRGISVEELVKVEVDEATARVTEEAVDAFYNDQRARGNRMPPKDRIVDQIRSYISRQNFMNTLREKYAVEMFLEEPRTTVEAKGPAKGPADAPVTLVEFSDFECPYCSRMTETLHQVTEKYGDKVRLVFRQYPLAMHANAQKAAEASLCAHEQGQFWAMHDLLFEEQKSLTVADLKEKAARLGLDSTSFDVCLDEGRTAAQVNEDLQAGARAGVSGTPAVFVNGKFFSGAQPLEAISGAIDEELAKLGGE
jgi:protein-disulfide isomerase